MIIVNQYKNKIINFDNVLEIWIEDNLLDKTEPVFTINAETDGTCIELGYYKNEERAKEVLEEIIEAVSVNELNGKYQELDLMMKFKHLIKYQMPEK